MAQVGWFIHDYRESSLSRGNSRILMKVQILLEIGISCSWLDFVINYLSHLAFMQQFSRRINMHDRMFRIATLLCISTETPSWNDLMSVKII